MAGPIPVHRAWLMASRPRTLLAALAPVAVGTGMAVAAGAFAAGPAIAALLGAVLIQIGTNLANDYYDHVKGGDTDDRVGPVRVTQSGILEPTVVLWGMWVTFGAAMLVGAYLVWIAGWPLVVVGLASIAAGIAYTGGPYPLGYHGLGDAFVFVFFGLVAVGGTFYVQALDLSADVLWAGAGIGALNTAILVVNNLRDLETDAAAGKRTLAVRLGAGGTRLEYALLLGTGAVVPLAGTVVAGWTPWSLLALLALVPAFSPLKKVMAKPWDPRALAPALGQTAAVTGLYGLLLGLGFALG